MSTLNQKTDESDLPDRVAIAKETRESAEKRISDRGRGNSMDRNDSSVGWTVQQGGLPNLSPVEDLQNLPGQVFHTSQLPNPEVQRAAGIDPVQQTAPLVVIEDEDEAFAHPSGPEAGELTRSVQREAVNGFLSDRGVKGNSGSSGLRQEAMGEVPQGAVSGTEDDEEVAKADKAKADKQADKAKADKQAADDKAKADKAEADKAKAEADKAGK